MPKDNVHVMRLPLLMSVIIAASSWSVVGAQDATEARFETYCSWTQPGNSVAEVQWPLTQAGTANLRPFAEQQVLDVTVYKDGFERGLYKTVKPGVARPEFHPSRPAERPDIPGLEKLKLTQFGTSQEPSKEGLRLQARPIAGQESADAKLEGLEAGLKYFVRLSSPDAAPKIVSFTAPSCPVDYVHPKKK
jgi:hypothetical protein